MTNDHKLTADELAIQRTAMAADRTLMAWVRTTLSMISFGFAIPKFYEYLHDSGKIPAGPDAIGPRNLGLALITLGLGALALACIQYAAQIRRLTGGRHAPLKLSLFVAAFLALIGTLALMNLLFQVGPF